MTVSSVHAVAELDAGFKPGIYHDNCVFQALPLPDGRLLLAGTFQNVAGASQPYLARLHSNGSLDTAFAPVFNNDVSSFAVQRDGKIVVVGTFSAVGGIPRQGLARLRADGSLDQDFAPELGLWPSSILLQQDGKLIVGCHPNGQQGFNGFRLNQDGTRDEYFGIIANGSITSMAPYPDGRIYVCGPFSSINGFFRSRIARLHENGVVDPSFDPTVNNPVTAVAVQPDGATLIAGQFTKVNNVTRNRLARFLANGTLDSAYSDGANNDVNSLVIQTDGKVVICGAFTFVGGSARAGLARLNANGSVDTTFDSTSYNLTVRTGVSLEANGSILQSGALSRPGLTAHHNVERYQGTAAAQTLDAPNLNQVRWLRGGSAPELINAWFELSEDGGLTWQELGPAHRISGGWGLGSLTLPLTGCLRARGTILGGSGNRSGSVVEMVS